MEDVVDTLLQIGKLRFKSLDEPLGCLTEKYSCFTGRIEKCSVGIGEKLLRQHIKHLVDNLGRRENFIVGEIRQARQYIGIVNIFK